MKNFTKNVIPMQQIGFALQVPFIPSEDDSVRLLFEVMVLVYSSGHIKSN